MAPLPRGVCSKCGALVPMRRNGDAREHTVLVLNRRVQCAGSGHYVRGVEKSQAPAPARKVDR